MMMMMIWLCIVCITSDVFYVRCVFVCISYSSICWWFVCVWTCACIFVTRVSPYVFSLSFGCCCCCCCFFYCYVESCLCELIKYMNLYVYVRLVCMCAFIFFFLLQCYVVFIAVTFRFVSLSLCFSFAFSFFFFATRKANSPLIQQTGKKGIAESHFWTVLSMLFVVFTILQHCSSILSKKHMRITAQYIHAYSKGEYKCNRIWKKKKNESIVTVIILLKAHMFLYVTHEMYSYPFLIPFSVIFLHAAITRVCLCMLPCGRRETNEIILQMKLKAAKKYGCVRVCVLF